MTENHNKKPRSVVYIDGFNLYHGIVMLGRPELKWLDIQGLSQSFQKYTELVGVNYFTAEITSGSGKPWPQKVYLEALATLPKVEIIYGHFISKGSHCRKCGYHHKTYEEKRTDVNIACQMLIDSYKDNFDVAFLVSGDSDLVAPVKHIVSAGKKVIVVSPPNRKSRWLVDVASHDLNITGRLLSKSLLPFEIKTKKEKTLTIPRKWKPKNR